MLSFPLALQNSASEQEYNTLRERQRERENSVCVDCMFPNRITELARVHCLKRV